MVVGDGEEGMMGEIIIMIRKSIMRREKRVAMAEEVEESEAVGEEVVAVEEAGMINHGWIGRRIIIKSLKLF